MLKITCTGRLGDDVKVITTSKTPFIAFNVAEIVGKKDQAPQWLDCTMGFDHGHEPAVAAYLKKGKTVLVEGRPYVKEFTKGDGSKGTALGVFVTYIELLDKKDSE